MAEGKKVRWGIISTANIGIEKVIPGILKSPHSEVVALASRDLARAHTALGHLGLRSHARAYGSYEELFADPNVDAVYNPLPNHLHVPMTLAAAKAGKHVLCEKPIAMNAKEAEQLREIPKGIVFSKPSWCASTRNGTVPARSSARAKSAKLRAVRAVFSYFNADPQNVRNMADIGGGGIMDIGCYPIVGSRFLFEAEPLRVVSLIDRDPTSRPTGSPASSLDFGYGRQVELHQLDAACRAPVDRGDRHQGPGRDHDPVQCARRHPHRHRVDLRRRPRRHASAAAKSSARSTSTPRKPRPSPSPCSAKSPCPTASRMPSRT